MFFNYFSFLPSHFLSPKGQTLIETLAALAIIGLVVSAIGVVVTTSLSNAKFDADQTLATKYAQQGSELMQQIRDDNYTNFKNYAGTYCLAKGQITISTPASCTTPNVDNFIRSVTIQQNGCGANIAQVTVDVSFTDGKCATGVYCHQQNVLTCLSTANPVQVP
jgi:type II secretory pathway pseudopilin PulG